MAISTFMGLETNKRGLMAQQTALYTVGHNISNANTVGYTRQRVNLSATNGFPSNGMNSPKVPGHLGTGVTTESITRVRDAFLDNQYRQETNNLGFWSQQTNAISQMEDIMSEPSPYGLNAAYDDFYTAWQELANLPSSSAARQVVYTKASHLASSFNYMNKQMTQVQQNLKHETLETVDKVNSILDRISNINNQVKKVETNGNIPNDLYDARDVLIDELSEYIPISTENIYSGGLATDDSEGAVQVYMILADGTKQMIVGSELTGETQTYNGQDRELYGESVASKLSLTTGDNISVTNSDDFQPLSGISLTKSLTTSLKVETDENGVITYTDTNGAVVAKVDSTAGTVTDDEGNVIDNASVDEKGVVSIVVAAEENTNETDKTITINPTLKGGKVTAAIMTTNYGTQEISLNKMSLEKGKLTSYAVSYGYTTGEEDADGNLAVKGFFYEKLKDLDKLASSFANEFNELHKVGYGLTVDGEEPTEMDFFTKVNEDDGEITAANIKVSDDMKNFNNIAASDKASEEGNGNLALKLSNLKTTVIESLNNTSAQKFYESMVADVGTQGEKATQMEYNSGTIQLTIGNNRASISSVSLDEEMTNMIMYQQAYNASARMITVVDEVLDKIINGMGRVGL